MHATRLLHVLPPTAFNCFVMLMPHKASVFLHDYCRVSLSRPLNSMTREGNSQPASTSGIHISRLEDRDDVGPGMMANVCIGDFPTTTVGTITPLRTTDIADVDTININQAMQKHDMCTVQLEQMEARVQKIKERKKRLRHRTSRSSDKRQSSEPLSQGSTPIPPMSLSSSQSYLNAAALSQPGPCRTDRPSANRQEGAISEELEVQPAFFSAPFNAEGCAATTALAHVTPENL